MEIKIGYSNIKVSRADFLRKVQVKNLPNGKRSHKQIVHIKRLYDRFKKLRNIPWVSPQEFLQYVIDNYSEKSGNFNFEITDIHYHASDKRKSVLFYSAEGKSEEDNENSMQFGRFFNIVSKLNNQKGI